MTGNQARVGLDRIGHALYFHVMMQSGSCFRLAATCLSCNFPFQLDDLLKTTKEGQDRV